MQGTVFMLNGASSSGKTTLARAMQDRSHIPLLYTGIDTCFGMVPPKWGGGRGGPLRFEGFRYVESIVDDRRPIVTIEYGPVGFTMIKAFQRSVAALAAGDFGVIVDEMMLSEDVFLGWLDVLDLERTYFIGVHCALDQLEARERDRGNRKGLARGYFKSVHTFATYDYEVHSDGGQSPSSVADDVLQACSDSSEPPSRLRRAAQQRGRLD